MTICFCVAIFKRQIQRIFLNELFCVVFFQSKQIIDLLNLNTLIFNFQFESLIFIEKYDCVICVVQQQRNKKILTLK